MHKSCKSFTWAVVAMLCWLLAGGAALAQAEPVKIGVLANSGAGRCQDQWAPTVQYLNEQIPGHDFTLICLEFGQVASAVRNKRVDFLLANPSIYNELADLGLSSVATLKRAGSFSVFAGVIFCRADREDILTLADLKGKTFMAVDPQSFGGWRMAWRELVEAGIEPLRDFKQLRFGSYHVTVPQAVLSGEVDAGTVRSGTLERLAQEGQLKLGDLRILRPQIHDQLPLLHSTRVYPEWPIARLGHTSPALAEKVAVALLNMPADSAACKAAGHAGWTTPENYVPVRNLLRELRLGPYKDLGDITINDVLRHYWPMISLSVLLFLSMAVSTALVLRLNRKIRHAHLGTLEEMARRQQVEQERERLLNELQTAMSNVKKLSGLLPICASCKKIRDDQGNWQQVEQYLAKKSEAQFSHGICPQCAQRLYPGLVPVVPGQD